jgi:rubredoxin
MNKSMFMCITCGYLYNEVKMRRRWSELPDDWVCPDCHSGKENYAELVIEPPSYNYPSEFNV